MTAFFQDLANQVPDYIPGSFESCFQQPNRCGRPSKEDPLPLNRILAQPASIESGGAPVSVSDATCAELTQQKQYLADLETLDRLEQQALYQDPCFFSAIGEIVARRVNG